MTENEQYWRDGFLALRDQRDNAISVSERLLEQLDQAKREANDLRRQLMEASQQIAELNRDFSRITETETAVDVVRWLRGRTGAFGGSFTSADDVADAIEKTFIRNPEG